MAINCDHEALNASNYKGKPEEWYKVIKPSVKYAQSKGLTVESIAPFNEPDYTSWNEGSKLDFLNICKKIRADKELDGIRLCGGNTLNCDQALSWYNISRLISTKEIRISWRVPSTIMPASSRK